MISHKPRILVTGANGQLGRELQDVLPKLEDFQCVFFTREQLDLTDLGSIYSKLEGAEPDFIINAAAYTAVDKAESEPELAYSVNHLAVKEIARYSRDKDCRLISISTDYVFQGDDASPRSESDFVNPTNIYGKSKLLGEQSLLEMAPESIIFRTSWVYSVYGNNFVKTMLRLMRSREQVSVVSDQYGSPTYARDLAGVICDIIQHHKWIAGVYHYSGEGVCSWQEFALAIRDYEKIDCEVLPVSSEQYAAAANRPKFSVLDKSKIKSTFDIEIPRWQDSLKQMLERLREESKGYN